MNQFKEVYKAPTEEAALMNLDTLEENWRNKYSLAIRTWRKNWDNLVVKKDLYRFSQRFLLSGFSKLIHLYLGKKSFSNVVFTD